ncbi:MAG: hypothetical protein LKG89_03495 [Lachnospiraceae bacterium]|jgi:hypothetical protein|nr:hypothetical protein [Lachnospiraceae bacterium]
MGKSEQKKEQARRNRLARAKEIFEEHPDSSEPDFLSRYCTKLGVDETRGAKDLSLWGISVSEEQKNIARKDIETQSRHRRARKQAIHVAGDCAVKGKKYSLPHNNTYCYILGEQDGITWEEVGVDPSHSVKQKIAAFLQQNERMGWKRYEHRVIKSGGRPTKRLKQHWEEQEQWCDGTFAYIAGYTSGGAPYGVTWEEMGIDPDLPRKERIRALGDGYRKPARETPEFQEEELPFD